MQQVLQTPEPSLPIREQDAYMGSPRRDRDSIDCFYILFAR